MNVWILIVMLLGPGTKDGYIEVSSVQFQQFANQGGCDEAVRQMRLLTGQTPPYRNNMILICQPKENTK